MTTEVKYEIVGLPAPEGSNLYIVEEEVYKQVAASGSRVDVFGVKTLRRNSKEEGSHPMPELLTGSWVRGNFNPLAHEQMR
jgi:hypothetical protein